MLQCTIAKSALAHDVQAQVHQFVTAHLGHLRNRLNQQTYRNLVDCTEGLVRMEASPQALWMSRLATEVFMSPATAPPVKMAFVTPAHSHSRC